MQFLNVHVNANTSLHKFCYIVHSNMHSLGSIDCYTSFFKELLLQNWRGRFNMAATEEHTSAISNSRSCCQMFGNMSWVLCSCLHFAGGIVDFRVLTNWLGQMKSHNVHEIQFKNSQQ